MPPLLFPAAERSTRRAIVKLLKTEGAMDSAQLAKRLRLTPMAVRQHLYALQSEQLVTADERPVPIGRPAKHWRLTPESDRLFPDAYAELNVALLDAVGSAFGSDGLQRVLESREAKQRAEYARRISPSAPLKERLQQLARVRTEEGYMAEVRADGPGAFLFIENHCPICAAATACQGFCATELDLFRSVLGANASVERTEHIVSGDRRCVYRVTAKPRTTKRR
ncbi:MAG TPA: metalloregulator ArsR/SmtB family transcription factor [Vicinamibacterales bacterium]|nr:metalloregulator ArsR/SmtB family transcription factor [Vicinamibacterales bacterium]